MNYAADIMFIFVSLCVYVLSVWMVYQSTRTKSLLTPAYFFIFLFSILYYPGGMYLFLTNGKSAFVSSGARNYSFYFAVNFSLLFLSAGVFAANRLFKFSAGTELENFRKKEWKNILTGTPFYVALGILTFISLLATYIYIRSRGEIPLIEAVKLFGSKGSYERTISNRLLFTTYGGGGGTYYYQGYFAQFYMILLPFIFLLSAVMALKNKSKNWLLFSAFIFIITSFALMSSIARWPILVFISYIFIMYQLYYGRITWKMFLTYTAVSLLIFTFITILRIGGEDVVKPAPAPGLKSVESVKTPVVVEEKRMGLLDSVFQRIIAAQINVIYSEFELFPRKYDYKLGITILRDFRDVLPGPDYSFSAWLYTKMFTNDKQYFGSGSAPSGYLGELYANFGLAGVFLGMFILGIILQWNYIFIIRSSKTLFGLATFPIIIFALGWSTIGGIVTILFQMGIVTMLLCNLCFIAFFKIWNFFYFT